MISVTIRIVHLRHRHCTAASVNALANDLPVNFTPRRQFHFAESTSGQFKCIRKNILGIATFVNSAKEFRLKMSILILNEVSWFISVLVLRTGHYTVQGIQGHRFWYQSKAHMRHSISH